MSSDRPSPETIEAWIDGRLPIDVAEEVESYFEKHPDELPGQDPDLSPLREADDLPASNEELTQLMENLISGSLTSVSEAPLDLLQPTHQEGMIGTLHDYQVSEVIAATGMGMVWKATDPQLKREVAIKALAPALSTNTVACRRFLQEARAMAALENDHVLPIYHIENSNPPWFVMRYVSGGSLQDLLDAGDTRVRDVDFIQSLARQLALGLQAAHQSGIIHRDLKPANVLCSRSEKRFWLTDFGIARIIDDPGLTYGHAVAGTPRYMSPEQAAGKVIDARSDLYSFGSVLYHVASGRPLFDGETSAAVIHQLTSAKVPNLRRMRPDLPRWLTDLIQHLLEPSPRDRPTTAGEVLRLLEQRRPRATKTGLVSVVFLILGLASLAFFLIPRSEPEQAPSGEKDPPEKQENDTHWVRNQTTGERYHDLAEAIHDADSKDSLVLHGTFLLDRPIVLKKGQDLNLRSTEGDVASIVFRHDQTYGILAHGDVRIQGINFIVGPTTREFHHMVARGANLLEVRHCHFEALESTTSVWACTAMGTPKAEIHSTTFKGGKVHAVLLYDGKSSEEASDISLTMQDCHINARAAVLCRSRYSKTQFQVDLQRNFFRGFYVLGSSRHNWLRKTTATISDGEYRCRQAYLVIGKASPEQIGERLILTWQNNDQRSKAPALSIIGPEPQKIQTFAELAERFPQITLPQETIRQSQKKIEGLLQELGKKAEKLMEDLKE